MKAFSVKFKDLKNSWSPRKIIDDTTIPKYCVKCGRELMYLVIYENGKEEEVLYCSACGGK